MASASQIKLTVIGATDNDLQEVLRSAGYQPTSVPAAELPALAKSAAAPPDVVVVDLRQSTNVPAAVADLTRRHPTIGVGDRRGTPGCRAHARSAERRRQRLRERPLEPPRISRSQSRASRSRRHRFPGRSSRSSARRAASARRRSRSTPRRPWPRSPAAAPCCSISTSATEMPRPISASSLASRWRTRSRTPIAWTTRSCAAWSCAHRVGSICWRLPSACRGRASIWIGSARSSISRRSISASRSWTSREPIPACSRRSTPRHTSSSWSARS